ncbi:hypothetical protein SKTS_23110 [Sulfurimicrobium lacus]|uniref:OmpA-like domain-containing protein n=1 Tax=Sulfurimicrobium lacus TaxID=2715678 RepID=A0A6F8VF86_9PROT|nr:hypothetical protein SKTS_23110 [Sulfurimicrobium lacus]
MIIGAMLIAPLMGPIVLLGFAIAETDVLRAIRSGKAIVAGVLGALVISAVIVKLSPYISPTPEIMARTNPNLFDLLVAVCSGMVAGYAVMRQQIGAVAGVAIATALMPPLATAGYGLAAADMQVFSGSFFLFLTNMLAIAFSVAGMAIWYGFGNLQAPRELLWKTLAAGAVLALLSVPLVDTLNESVSKSLALKRATDVLREDMVARGMRMDKLQVNYADNGNVLVGAVALVPKYDEGAPDRMQAALRQALGKPVHFQLDQVVIGSAEQAAQKPSVIANPVTPLPVQPPPLTETQLIEQYLRQVFPLPISMSEIDSVRKSATLQLADSYAGNLQTLYNAERDLQSKFPGWEMRLVPPLRGLPVVNFDSGEAELDPVSLDKLRTVQWALQRWGLKRVDVVGYASLGEKGRASAGLASKRAEIVAAWLVEAGFETEKTVIYPAPGQKDEERERGQAAFRRTQILPNFPVDH